MNRIPTKIPGLAIFEPQIFSDERGFFSEIYNATRYVEAGIPDIFVQDNLSCSRRGVVRGLHYQDPPFGQGKLVQVLRGRVMDVAVDLRIGSPTFGEYEMVELSGENHRQFWIPEGFAHGFVALEDNTIFQYKCTALYSPPHDRGIRFDDPDIGISWPISEMLVSAKDKSLPFLREITSPFRFSDSKNV